MKFSKADFRKSDWERQPRSGPEVNPFIFKTLAVLFIGLAVLFLLGGKY